MFDRLEQLKTKIHWNCVQQVLTKPKYYLHNPWQFVGSSSSPSAFRRWSSSAGPLGWSRVGRRSASGTVQGAPVLVHGHCCSGRTRCPPRSASPSYWGTLPGSPRGHCWPDTGTCHSHSPVHGGCSVSPDPAPCRSSGCCWDISPHLTWSLLVFHLLTSHIWKWGEFSLKYQSIFFFNVTSRIWQILSIHIHVHNQLFIKKSKMNKIIHKKNLIIFFSNVIHKCAFIWRSVYELIDLNCGVFPLATHCNRVFFSLAMYT